MDKDAPFEQKGGAIMTMERGTETMEKSTEHDRTYQENRWQDLVRRLQGEPELPFAEIHQTYLQLAASRSSADGPLPVWFPDPASRTNLHLLMEACGCDSYQALYQWSVAYRADFWRLVIKHLQVVFATEPETVLDPASGVTDPCWLAGAELNITASCFSGDPARAAIVYRREGSKETTVISSGVIFWPLPMRRSLSAALLTRSPTSSSRPVPPVPPRRSRGPI